MRKLALLFLLPAIVQGAASVVKFKAGDPSAIYHGFAGIFWFLACIGFYICMRNRDNKPSTEKNQ